MIQPSTGRIVLYRPNGATDPDPHAAIVIAVHGERSVNLACFSPAGTYYHREEVPLLQDDDSAPAEGGFAEWMVYQKGQAAKAEVATNDLHPRLAALEEMLKTGGPIHGLFEKLQTDVADKFHETGAFLEAKFGEIDQKLTGAPAAQPDTPPAPTEPNPAPPEQQAANQEHAADGKPQGQ